MNILIKLSGSIACYKTCDLISRLVKAGHQVQTVTTQSAEKFIGTATLEGLTGRQNLSNLWKTGDQMAHIRLPEWADVTLLCPATANTINKLANGIGDDLLTTLFQAHEFPKPYYIAPAMNPRMLSHPATEASLEKLKSWGIQILPTGEGRLACGDFGYGKLLEIDEIFNVITGNQPFQPESGRSFRLLITSGGTEEPIDSVRVLTNLSSGKTGAYLADYFARMGHDITLLHSHRAVTPSWRGIRTQTFRTVGDLENSLKLTLAAQPFDGIIHLAAVSDFSLSGTEPEEPGGTELTKLDSDAPVDIVLTPTRKLLPHLKGWATASSAEPFVVGFKLTDTLTEDMEGNPALAMIQSDRVDAVVHNARTSIDAESDSHPCMIYFPNGEKRPTETKLQMAETLEALLKNAISASVSV